MCDPNWCLHRDRLIIAGFVISILAILLLLILSVAYCKIEVRKCYYKKINVCDLWPFRASVKKIFTMAKHAMYSRFLISSRKMLFEVNFDPVIK